MRTHENRKPQSNQQQAAAGLATGYLKDNRSQHAVQRKAGTALIEKKPFYEIAQLKPKADNAETSSGEVVQRIIRLGKKTAKGQQATAISGKRYSGHNSAANKRALLHVLRYRKHDRHMRLSYPEETALANSTTNNPQTGLANRTPQMPRGTAICHKISDNSIRAKINGLLHLEKGNGNKQPLNGYLQMLVNYIKPEKRSDDTPSSGPYWNEARYKYATAKAQLDAARGKAAGSSSRAIHAHTAGKNVANSPVNLFLGDSITNSSIHAHFDQNTYGGGVNPPLTPRSERAKPVNDLIDRVSFAAVRLNSGRTKKSSRPGDQ